MQGLGLFLIFVISLVSLCAVDAHTAADDLRQLTKGGSNVVLGAIKGEVELIRRGVAEGGEYNSVLDARLGTMIFRLGRVWEDFPKWPSLHLSIAGGKRPHLNAAFFLMGTGAVSVNDYQLPLTITDGLLPNALDVGYGPAFVYALGMGGIKPTASHGALLQRLYESLPDQFNMSHVNVWLNQTANPPLIHFPVYAGFEEGLHVLKDDFKLSLNEQDYFGSTPLHVATWLGDLELLAYLLNSGADRLIKDKNGKLALHYAVSRGYSGAVEMLLIAPQKYSPKKALDMRRKMFSQKDKDGRTPIDQAKLPPAHPKVLASLERFSFELDGQQSRLNQRYPLKDDSRTAQFVLELEDALGTRGGWNFPKGLQVENGVDKEEGKDEDWDEDDEVEDGKDNTQNPFELDMDVDIDVVSSDRMSKGKFKRDYFSTQRPVLVTGQLFENQGLWAHWRKEDLLLRYGDINLYHTHGKQITTSLRDWVNVYAKSHEENEDGSNTSEGDGRSRRKLSYARSRTTSNVPLLVDDVKVPALLNLCGPNDNQPVQITLSASSSISPLMSGPASWDVLIVGKRTWFLIPPSNGRTTMNIDAPGNELDIIKELESLRLSDPEKFLQRTSELRAQGLVHEVSQMPGETLFVPHDWTKISMGHVEADSISFTREFCSHTHSDQRFLPVGQVLYGGRDDLRGLGHPCRDYQDMFNRLAMMEVEQSSNLPTFGNPLSLNANDL